MPAVNLKNMNIDALLSLRADIDKRLDQERSALEKQLSRLSHQGTGRMTSNSLAGRKTSAMKGLKVAPKYRGPAGETWAGRGARPRWLAALMKQGRKLEEFAIRKPSLARKGAAAKRARRKRK